MKPLAGQQILSASGEDRQPAPLDDRKELSCVHSLLSTHSAPFQHGTSAPTYSNREESFSTTVFTIFTSLHIAVIRYIFLGVQLQKIGTQSKVLIFLKNKGTLKIIIFFQKSCKQNAGSHLTIVKKKI